MSIMREIEARRWNYHREESENVNARESEENG